MRYKTSIPQELEDAKIYFAQLIATDAEIELKKVNKRRSLNQNNYYWLTLTAFSLDTGFSIEESAVIFKREVNRATFAYEKNGQMFLRSSADLDTKEMSDCMDRFHKYASDNGIELPRADEEDWLRRIENEAERLKRYI